MSLTANQIKMKKVREARGKGGGCSSLNTKIKCGNGGDAAMLKKLQKDAMEAKKKEMQLRKQSGNGAATDAAKAALKKAAQLAAELARKAVQYARDHPELVKGAIRAGTSALADATGQQSIKAIGEAFGSGQCGRGPGVNTGMQATPAISYPNSAAPFTGRLVF